MTRIRVLKYGTIGMEYLSGAVAERSMLLDAGGPSYQHPGSRRYMVSFNFPHLAVISLMRGG